MHPSTIKIYPKPSANFLVEPLFLFQIDPTSADPDSLEQLVMMLCWVSISLLTYKPAMVVVIIKGCHSCNCHGKFEKQLSNFEENVVGTGLSPSHKQIDNIIKRTKQQLHTVTDPTTSTQPYYYMVAGTF